MDNHLTLPALSLLPILLTVGAAIWMVRANNKNSYDWFLRVMLSAAAIIFAFAAFPWAILSYYLRFFALLVFLFALMKSSLNLKNREIFARAERKGRLKINIKLALLAALVALNVLTIMPFFEKNAPAVDLTFPLKNGNYAIVQGGNSIVTNVLHRLNPEEVYAIDIVQLNFAGAHANGFFPESLNDYEIFGRDVLSPCSGKVVKIQDRIIDNYPGTRNEEKPDGNFIILSCKDVRVTFKHLKSGSVSVKPDEEITTGHAIAKAGNSGDSTTPHLHLSAAIKDSNRIYEPTQVSFNKTIPIMNRLFYY